MSATFGAHLVTYPLYSRRIVNFGESLSVDRASQKYPHDSTSLYVCLCLESNNHLLETTLSLSSNRSILTGCHFSEFPPHSQESPLNNNNNNNRTNGADIIGDNCCAGIPKLSSQCENGEASEVNYGLIGANSRPSTGGGSVSVCSGTAVTAEDPNLLSPNNSQRSSMSQSQSPTHHLQPSGCSPEELDEVGTFFDEHAAAIERWFRERAPPEVIAKLQSITGGGDVCKSTPRSPHRASVTSDLFQQWLASSPVKVSFVLLDSFYG